MRPISAPPGYHVDPFADVRLGLSLFAMSPEDWLVPDLNKSSPDSDTPAAATAGVSAHPQHFPAGERT